MPTGWGVQKKPSGPPGGLPYQPQPAPVNQAPSQAYGPPPPSFANTNVQANPQLNALMGDWDQYGKQLSTNSDLEAVTALRRMQAMGDRNVRMAGSGAAQRLGAGSGVEEKVRGRAAAGVQSAMSGANIDLAAQGRKAQLGALQGKTQAGQAMVGDMRQAADQAMKQAQLGMNWNQWEQERQDRLSQQGFQNNYQMLQFATQPQFWNGA